MGPPGPALFCYQNGRKPDALRARGPERRAQPDRATADRRARAAGACRGHRRAGDLVGDPVERGLSNELACGGEQVGRPIEGVVSMQKRAKDANQLTPLLKASIMPTHTLYLVLLLVKRDRPSPTGLQMANFKSQI